MNIGHVILVVAATIVGYLLYNNMECARKKAYFRHREISEEARLELEKEGAYNRRTIIARLAIWCTCAVFCLFGGNILATILTAAFTIDALLYIYVEAYSAAKSRVSALTFLALPFGALIMAYGMMSMGIIVGILLGVLTVALVQIIPRIHIPDLREGGE